MLLSFLCILFWCQAVVTIPFMKSKQTEKSLRHPCFFCFCFYWKRYLSVCQYLSFEIPLYFHWLECTQYLIHTWYKCVQTCTYIDWLMTVIWFHLSTQSYLHQRLVHPHGECAWIFFFLSQSHIFIEYFEFHEILWVPICIVILQIWLIPCFALLFELIN